MKLFVAVGEKTGDDTKSTIMHSTDGKTWTKATSGGFGVGGRGVAYSPVHKLWVAVGQDADQQSTIQHSTDGKTWTKATSGGFTGSTGAGSGVAYNPVHKLWVAVGDINNDDPKEAAIQHSTDGKTWTKATSGGFSDIWKRRGVQPRAQALGGGREDPDGDDPKSTIHALDGREGLDEGDERRVFFGNYG
jgi:hypothetical protein